MTVLTVNKIAGVHLIFTCGSTKLLGQADSFALKVIIIIIIIIIIMCIEGAQLAFTWCPGSV
jgi:hypothetical protein